MLPHQENLPVPGIEAVAEDLALEGLVRELDVQAALEELLDGRGKDSGALVVVTLEILPFEENDAEAEVARAGELHQLDGGPAASRTATDDRHRLSADLPVRQYRFSRKLL